MVDRFGDQRHLGHECEGLHEVSKDQITVQFSSHQLPVRQRSVKGGKIFRV
jgi:hypothetical protein